MSKQSLEGHKQGAEVQKQTEQNIALGQTQQNLTALKKETVGDNANFFTYFYDNSNEAKRQESIKRVAFLSADFLQNKDKSDVGKAQWVARIIEKENIDITSPEIQKLLKATGQNNIYVVTLFLSPKAKEKYIKKILKSNVSLPEKKATVVKYFRTEDIITGLGYDTQKTKAFLQGKSTGSKSKTIADAYTFIDYYVAAQQNPTVIKKPQTQEERSLQEFSSMVTQSVNIVQNTSKKIIQSKIQGSLKGKEEGNIQQKSVETIHESSLVEKSQQKEIPPKTPEKIISPVQQEYRKNTQTSLASTFENFPELYGKFDKPEQKNIIQTHMAKSIQTYLQEMLNVTIDPDKTQNILAQFVGKEITAPTDVMDKDGNLLLEGKITTGESISIKYNILTGKLAIKKLLNPLDKNTPEVLKINGSYEEISGAQGPNIATMKNSTDALHASQKTDQDIPHFAQQLRKTMPTILPTSSEKTEFQNMCIQQMTAQDILKFAQVTPPSAGTEMSTKDTNNILYTYIYTLGENKNRKPQDFMRLREIFTQLEDMRQKKTIGNDANLKTFFETRDREKNNANYQGASVTLFFEKQKTIQDREDLIKKINIDTEMQEKIENI